MNKLDLLKDTLELMRNYFFAGGAVVVAGNVAYYPESVGAHGNLIGTTVILVALAYMALAIWYFEKKNWPEKLEGFLSHFYFFSRLFVFVLMFHGSLIAVSNHTVWAHNREVAAAHAAKTTSPVAIPSPISRCLTTK